MVAGRGSYKVHSDWASGELYFYEKAVGRTTTGDLFKLGTSEITVGNTGQDVDFKVFLGSGTEYVLFDAGNSRVDFGVSATGIDVRFFGDTADSDFLWDQDGDTKGALTLGADTKNVDFRVYGSTTGNYLHWDGSADDLLLVGTATQLAVAGDTDSTTTTSGSLRTAGGLGVVKDAFFGGLITTTGTTGFRSNPTFVPDSTYTNYAFSVGNKVAELTVNFANTSNQNFNPIQAIVNCTATSTGPTNLSQMNLFYSLITHDTNAMSNIRLKCADFSVVANKDCQDLYAYQGEIILSSTMTVGGEACVLGLVMDAGSGTVTGSAVGIHMALRGSALTGMTSYGFYMSVGDSATLDNGIYIETLTGATITTSIRLGCASGTTVTAGLHVGGAGTFTAAMVFAGTITYFADFDACSGANATITSDSGSAATSWKARIKVKTDDGTTAWINCYSTSNE